MFLSDNVGDLQGKSLCVGKKQKKIFCVDYFITLKKPQQNNPRKKVKLKLWYF